MLVAIILCASPNIFSCFLGCVFVYLLYSYGFLWRHIIRFSLISCTDHQRAEAESMFTWKCSQNLLCVCFRWAQNRDVTFLEVRTVSQILYRCVCIFAKSLILWIHYLQSSLSIYTGGATMRRSMWFLIADGCLRWHVGHLKGVVFSLKIKSENCNKIITSNVIILSRSKQVMKLAMTLPLLRKNEGTMRRLR